MRLMIVIPLECPCSGQKKSTQAKVGRELSFEPFFLKLLTSPSPLAASSANI